LLAQWGRGLFTAIITISAQGLALLSAASAKYGYGLDLAAVARIWRGGCIIRAGVLEDINAAYLARPQLRDLLLDPALARMVAERQEDLRASVGQAVNAGVPVPGLMVSLGYLDALRSPWQPANLIQAQRDYFDAHTYERTDAKGTFHTDWEKAGAK
jgi:6-phosphogluconate dehydrogenase